MIRRGGWEDDPIFWIFWKVGRGEFFFCGTIDVFLIRYQGPGRG